MSETRGKVAGKRKDVLRNGISYYSVTIVGTNGSGYRPDAFGVEAHSLEKVVKHHKRLDGLEGPTPKIFNGGHGSPDEPPGAAGCTNQKKSIGLSGDPGTILRVGLSSERTRCYRPEHI